MGGWGLGLDQVWCGWILGRLWGWGGFGRQGLGWEWVRNATRPLTWRLGSAQLGGSARLGSVAQLGGSARLDSAAQLSGLAAQLGSAQPSS